MTLPFPLPRQESMLDFNPFLTCLHRDHSVYFLWHFIILVLVHLMPLSCQAATKCKYIRLITQISKIRHKMSPESEVGSCIRSLLRKKLIRLSESLEGCIWKQFDFALGPLWGSGNIHFLQEPRLCVLISFIFMVPRSDRVGKNKRRVSIMEPSGSSDADFWTAN